MAGPNNDHHVHSDGYYGGPPVEPDAEQRMDELLDDVENNLRPTQIDTVEREGSGQAVVTVDDERAIDTVVELAHDYHCRVEYELALGLPVEIELYV